MQNQTMSQIEYEEFVTKVKALSEEQQVIAARNLPDVVLWNEIEARYAEAKIKLDNILNAARA